MYLIEKSQFPQLSFTWHGWTANRFNFRGAKIHWSEPKGSISIEFGWFELGPISVRYQTGRIKHHGVQQGYTI